jgi:signal transduction histidine kinase
MRVLRNSKLLLRVTAPPVAVGLVLMIACFAGVSYISRIQRNLAEILADNVTSLQTAQELELAVRQLRFHNLLYLMDPAPERLGPIEADQKRFESALAVARQSLSSHEEETVVQAIAHGYERYQTEQAQLRSGITTGKPVKALQTLIDSHPVRSVVDPCQELLRISKVRMERTAEETSQAAGQGSLAMLLLGLAGPLGGLVMGYGVARGLRQSIYRLSVRVQDMAQHLETDVATVSVIANGDFKTLDTQMHQIVGQIEAVGNRLQTQQRELLRAEQLAVVGRLAAGVAHEVRNPLTGIKLLVEAARRSKDPRPLNSEDLRMIHRELERVEHTVQGLLDYARLPEPHFELCDIRDSVGQALEVIRERADRQGVAVQVHVPNEPVVARMDRDQIHTVLVNLFVNALDAMPNEGRLDISWKPIDDLVHISVADSGTGIPSDIVEKLFTPFATTKTGGTGLGLSLSARIVEEHRGVLTAANQPEGGACFEFTLPLGAVENPQ